MKHRIKKFVNDYLVLSKKERNASIILVVLIAIIIALPSFIPSKKIDLKIDEKLQAQVDSLSQKHPQNFTNSNNSYADSASPLMHKQPDVALKLFSFDPNTLDETGFEKLGLQPKTIHTIINYRSKGGHFYKPEDIKKIYGLPLSQADKLVPFIKIASSKEQPEKRFSSNTAEDHPQPKTMLPASLPTKTYHSININTATADDWKSLPGIGDVIANRIVKFRTAIGGFKTVDDVKKTYGISDSTFILLRPYLNL